MLMSTVTGCKPVKLALASGKGGTGKTTLSTALALSARGPVWLLDCDVEEPNCHIFIQPESQRTVPVPVPVPVIDDTKCTGCGACGEICQFNAIVPLGKKTLVFPELCHSCGGCARVCPSGAITEQDIIVGTLEISTRDHVTFVKGQLDVGRAMSGPVIKAVKQFASDDHVTVIDCPPGTSCPMIAAVSGVDFVLLVTEPTPFGLHDLRLAVETVRTLGLPFGVAINRSDAGDDRVETYCRDEDIAVMVRIPEDRRIAEAYSNGNVLTAAVPEYIPVLQRLIADIQDRVTGRQP